MAAIAALGAVVVVMVVIVVRSLGGPGPSDALTGYLAALERGDPAAAAAFTNGEAGLVSEQIQANIDGLDGATVEAEVTEVSERGSEATAKAKMTWEVPEFGAFEYTNDAFTLSFSEDRWLVDWSSRAIHPALREDGQRLGTVEEFKPRAPILDRDGEELVSLGSVVDVGVLPSEVEEIPTTVSAIAAVTDVNPETLTEAIEGAEGDAAVPAITLREQEFSPVEAELRAVPGIQLAGRETPLAPTRDFARALLGTVGPATAEQVKKSDGELDADDIVGQSGLSAAFDAQLAGEPERSIVIRNADAEPVETLETREGEPGEPLMTTLSADVQSAAEDALAEVEGSAALVALDPKRGDILAVANRPTESGLNLAFTGQYPPGSTFKVISTAALLETGLDTTEIVECPASIDVGGREFVNFEGSAAGAVPFSTDFSQSCNTAFVSLADELEPTALRDTAEQFGLGIDPDLKLDAFGGDVPPGKDEVEEAAAMIGQARILASPLAMAGVVATVQSGEWHRPRLVADDPEEEGEPLPPGDLADLRTLMRSVVTSGTGTALAAVPGEPIGKSGTAEFGTADPPKTHAWFIAAREDVAVAVLVEEGTSGGEVAAPIAASFLTALPLG
ncbi:MAG: penicillin-binding transpeptidase domain-containing protein [Actinomycetota bacterium]|nr:penicillin-binding transpeptidase domain-containing protein [Actinomycetota bacterium]